MNKHVTDSEIYKINNDECIITLISYTKILKTSRNYRKVTRNQMINAFMMMRGGINMNLEQTKRKNIFKYIQIYK